MAQKTLNEIFGGGGTPSPQAVASGGRKPLSEIFGGSSTPQITTPAMTPAQIKDTASRKEFGPAFPASTERDTAVGAALKTAGNFPGSLKNFAWNTVKFFLDTPGNVAAIPGEVKKTAETPGVGVWDVVKEMPGATYDVLVPKFFKNLISGDLEEAQRTITNDPAGQLLPVIMAAKPIAKSLGVEARFNKVVSENPALKTTKDVVSKVVDTTVKTVKKPIGSIFQASKNVATGAAAKTIGIEPESVSAILKKPGAFTSEKITGTSPEAVARTVYEKLSERIMDLEDTGKEYGKFRKITTPTEAQPMSNLSIFQEANRIVKPGVRAGEANPALDAALAKKQISLDGILKDKFGLNVVKDKIKADSTSITRNQADITAIQRFYDNWNAAEKNTMPGKFTIHEFLNLRSDLTELSRFDKVSGKSKASEVVAKTLRNAYNEAIRPKIKGKIADENGKTWTLEELDREFENETNALKAVRKEYFDKEGNFQDNAISKIGNLGNAGKIQQLARLEKLIPGISETIGELRVIKDIQRSGGSKVGTYTRTGVQVLGGINFGVIGFITSLILTDPMVAVGLLRYIGYAKNTAKVAVAKTAAIKVKLGLSLTEKELAVLGEMAVAVQNMQNSSVLNKEKNKKTLEEIFKSK